MVVSIRNRQWNADPLCVSRQVIFVRAMPPDRGSHGRGAEHAARQFFLTTRITNLCPSPD
jgi:hypothetical protein